MSGKGGSPWPPLVPVWNLEGREGRPQRTAPTWVLLVLSQFEFRYCCAMDFVGSVSQTQCAHARPRRCKLEVLRHSATAACLDGAIDDPQRHVRSDNFYHCDLCASGLVANRIHHVSRLQRQQSRLLDFNARRRYIGLNGPLSGNWFAERHARPNALAHSLE